MSKKIGRRNLLRHFSSREASCTFEVTYEYSQNTVHGVRTVTTSRKFYSEKHAGNQKYRIRLIKTCWQFFILKTFPYVKWAYYNHKQVNRFAPLLKTGQFNVKEIRIRND